MPNHADYTPGAFAVQPKWDGFRCLLTEEGAFSRHGKPLPRADKFLKHPDVCDFFDEMAPIVDWIDCELLGTRDDGDLTLIVFDFCMKAAIREDFILEDMEEEPDEAVAPWVLRNKILSDFFHECSLTRPPNGVWLTPSGNDPAKMFKSAYEAGHEGIVIKEPWSGYAAGDTCMWTKFRFSEQGL